MATITKDRKIQIAFSAMRQEIDKSGYGGWVKNKVLMDMASTIFDRIEREEQGKPPIVETRSRPLEQWQKS